MFISVEGMDGAGKTTFAKNLAVAIEAIGRIVVLTREPYNSSSLNVMIKELEEESIFFRPLAIAYVYMSNRCQHVTDFIWPAIQRGYVVISDRYVDSTAVYQGLLFNKSSDYKTIMDLCYHALSSPPLPQLTFLLDIDPQIAFDRIAARDGNPESIKKLKAIRHGYMHLKKIYPERIYGIDASKSQEEMVNDALKIYTKKVKELLV